MMSLNAAELRSNLHRQIDELDDKFIAVIYSMVDTYLEQQKNDPIIGYRVDGTPIYASVARKEYKARLDAVEKGEYITIEELEKESTTWLKGESRSIR
ncbi:MAG: hypothetical protein AAF798_11230 [Bacteroidota bacterium]